MRQTGTRERHLESILEATLRQIILVNSFPRTLIQVVLQVTVAPDNEYVNAKVAQASLVSHSSALAWGRSTSNLCVPVS